MRWWGWEWCGGGGWAGEGVGGGEKRVIGSGQLLRFSVAVTVFAAKPATFRLSDCQTAGGIDRFPHSALVGLQTQSDRQTDRQYSSSSHPHSLTAQKMHIAYEHNRNVSVGVASSLSSSFWIEKSMIISESMEIHGWRHYRRVFSTFNATQTVQSQ